MFSVIKGIFMAIVITGFLIILMSLGAVGFIVFVAVMLGYFVSALNRGLKRHGIQARAKRPCIYYI